MRRCSKNLVVAVVALLFFSAMLAQNAALLLAGRGSRRRCRCADPWSRSPPCREGGLSRTTTDADGQFRIESYDRAFRFQSIRATLRLICFSQGEEPRDSCRYAFGPEKSLCNFGDGSAFQPLA